VRSGAQKNDDVARAEQEIARLKVAISGRQAYADEQAKRVKGFQQTIRRSRGKLQLTSEELTAARVKLSEDDQKLLRCVKAAESKLEDQHPQHFKHVFRRLAQAILDGKLHMDSIELEYICQLAVNLSQKYTNKFTYTDNIMRFCSALLKLQSGRAVLQLLRAGSPDNKSTSAQLIKNTHVNWHFPSESSIMKWDEKHDIDPTFSLGVSAITIEHMQNTTQGVLRIGADATDCHGQPAFLPGGKFERGDVFFPGSGYDASKLEDEYGKLARPVEKFAASPSSIENVSTAKRCQFVANCMIVREFLQERIIGMHCNLEALSRQLSRHREEYQRRQHVRAQKKGALKETTPTEFALDQDEEELNAAQKRQLDKVRTQFEAAQYGIQIVKMYLNECEEQQPVPYLLASTVLNALREYFKTEREMACKIFEVRLCTVSPEASGTSYVIARYLLRDGTTVEEMRVIRAAVMTTITEFPNLLRRLELESADGEHFKLLWQMAEHPQSAIELWEKNESFIKELRTQMILETGKKSLCTSAKVELRKKFYAYYVRHVGLLKGFTIVSLPRASTPIRRAVESMGFGSKVHKSVNTTATGKDSGAAATLATGKAAGTAATSATDEDFERWPKDDVRRSAGWFGRQELMWHFEWEMESKGSGRQSHDWDTWLLEDMKKFGQDGDVPFEKRIFSGAEIQTYMDLRRKLNDPSVGYEEFEDAVSRQNFHFLAKEAQSNSRVSTVQERLSDSAFYARQAGHTKQSEKIELILSLLENLKQKPTDSELISILIEILPMDQLQDVIEIYEELQYNKVVWLPQRDEILRKTICKHEDFFHKLKRVTSSVRTQSTIGGAGKKASSKENKVLLDKEKLLEIARKKPRAHKLVIDALTGIGSDAMDPFAQSRMFVDQTFYEDVHEVDPNLALILRTIGEWYDAFNKSGLSGAERARRLCNMRELFDSVLGNLWYCHKKPPSSIAGMPLRLWYALAANSDSTRVLVNVKLDRESHATAGPEDSSAGKKRRSEPFTNRPFKKPRSATETSARQAEQPSPGQGDQEETFQLIRRLQNSLVKYRYIGTYDLEGGFSSLVMMVGFKPAIRIALGILKKAQTLSYIRSMSQRGFWFYRSRRARYDYAVGRQDRGISLVDEWFGIEGFAKTSKRDAARERTLKQEVVVHVRDFSKRQQTSKRASKTDPPQ
jgi:hypothetical protein